MVRSRRRYLLAAAGVVLLGLGLWQTGGSLWIAAKAQVAQVLLERAWARAEQSTARPRAWPWADTWPVARLSVPRLGKSLIVLAGASGEALAFGPGHLTGTPPPGRPGISVIAGHRDTHFHFLQQLRKGDAIRLETPGAKSRRFEVTATIIVDARHSGLDPAAGDGRGQPMLALVTCWPFDALSPGGQARYLVFGESRSDSLPGLEKHALGGSPRGFAVRPGSLPRPESPKTAVSVPPVRAPAPT